MTIGNAMRSAGVRVLINALHAKSGGGVTYLRNILPRLADDTRLELHLFLHEEQYELFAPIDERVRLHLLDFAPKLRSLMLWEQISLPVVARMMAADVTFSPANFGPLFAPNPVIVLRNALAVAGTEKRLNKRLYWAGLGILTAVSLLGCRRAIAVSDYARTHLTRHLGARVRSRTAIVYHGVDPMFSPGPAMAETAADGRFLLAVADLYVQKNLHTLIAALAKVRARHPDIRLRIAGRRIDEGYFAILTEAIARHGLQDHVIFLGERPPAELVGLYRSCAAFVFPSTVETFGNPLAEAMACGAPIVSSNAAAMPEVVGDAALLFDPLDPGEMAAQILHVLEDPALADTLAARGVARAARFTWEQTARATAEVLLAAAGRDATPEAVPEARS